MAYLPNVSVVVPVHNSEKTVERCILSLLELNYPKESLELLFVNNASTDRTSDILNQYGDEIHILYEGKRGPAAARNKGLLNARGDVIAFTDSDCVVDKDWLQNIISPLEDPLVGVVGGQILSKRPCNEIEEFGDYIHDHNKAINVYKPPYVITMNWSSRLSVLKEVSLFDESFMRCEDVDLAHRVSQSGYSLVFKPEAIIYHRNENTLGGLFREGFLHGFYSVQTLKRHRTFLKNFGHRRFDGRTYTAIVSSLIDYILGREPNHSFCCFTFDSGKKIGKIFGSVRFLYFEV
jgi:glycosyltransferase involved in cell wall biosynthesis